MAEKPVVSAGRTIRVIGVVPPGSYGLGTMTRGAYAREFIAGIADVCDEFGANICLVSGLADRKRAGINDPLIDGLILSRAEDMGLIESSQRTVPVVVMDAAGVSGVSTVEIDEREGGRLAARHLIGIGHRRFALLTVLRRDGEPIFHARGESDGRLVAGLPNDQARASGFLEILADSGIEPGDVPIVETFHEQGSSLLLERSAGTTAVFAASDELALELIAAARRRGLTVPRELSVVGFDDIPAAASADPPLTTIVQPTAEKGRAAARMLFAPGPPSHLMLPVTLVVRASTAPPPAG